MKVNFAVHRENRLISQIAKEVNLGFAQAESNIRVTAAKLNTMLGEKGYLVSSAYGWKSTVLGESHGITSTLTTTADKKYYRNEYTLEAQKHVMRLACEQFGHVSAGDSDLCAYSRTTYRELENRYKTEVIVLESPQGYWSYYRSAEILRDVCKVETFYNRNQEIGACIDKHYLTSIEIGLNNAGYVLVCPTIIRFLITESLVPAKGVHAKPLPSKNVQTVRVNSLMLLETEGAQEEILLRIIPEPDPVYFWSPTAQTVLNTLELPKDCITVNSPVAMAAMEKKAGSTFTASTDNGKITYTLLEVDNSIPADALLT